MSARRSRRSPKRARRRARASAAPRGVRPEILGRVRKLVSFCQAAADEFASFPDGGGERPAGRQRALDERQRFLVAPLVRQRLREVVEHDHRRRVAPLGVTQHRFRLGQFAERVVGVGKTDRDRKSTRLNSSHSQISYAVFCLKKKTSDNILTAYLIQTEISAPSIGRK